MKSTSKEIEKDIRKELKCGCILVRRQDEYGVRYEISERCKMHLMNNAKKIEQYNRSQRKASQSRFTKNRK